MLGKQFGCDPHTIINLLKRNNIPTRTPEEIVVLLRKKYGLSEEQKQEKRTRDNKKKRVKNVAKWRRIIYEHLFGNHCVDCGCNDWTILQFDHKDPTLKESSIGRLEEKSPQRLIKEMAKCEVVCPNCHAKRTAKMFGCWRLTYEGVGGHLGSIAPYTHNGF